MGDLVDHLLALEGPLALEGVGYDEDGDMATVRIAICRNHLQLHRLECCRCKWVSGLFARARAAEAGRDGIPSRIFFSIVDTTLSPPVGAEAADISR